MTKKYYFENEDSGYCFTFEYFNSRMKEEGISEMKVFEAVPIKDDVFIFCKSAGEVGEKSECGKSCCDYKPRNGKNGMCSHRGGLRDWGKEVILTVKYREINGTKGIYRI